MSKEKRDLDALTPEVKEACLSGAEFRCHARGGGTCYGSLAWKKANTPKRADCKAWPRCACILRGNAEDCRNSSICHVAI